MVFNDFKVVLSDAGDVLFDNVPSLNRQKEVLTQLADESGKNMPLDEVYALFKPYKVLSQLSISIEDAISDFFEDNRITATYDDYTSLIEQKTSYYSPTLFPSVTETLEDLHALGIPFYLLTDASELGDELYQHLERMIIFQLKERGVYYPDTFDVKNYVAQYISSKDVGMKKPHPGFFDYALQSGENPFKRSEAIFLAHESKEIFGAISLGICVAAINFWIEPDAVEISKGILEHNEKFKAGQAEAMVYIMNQFSDLLGTI